MGIDRKFIDYVTDKRYLLIRVNNFHIFKYDERKVFKSANQLQNLVA